MSSYRASAAVPRRHRRSPRGGGERRTGRWQDEVFRVLGAICIKRESPSIAMFTHLPRELHKTVAGVARHVSDMSTESRK